jgi:lysozyme
MTETLEQRITRHECIGGKPNLKPYVDTVGKITIGIGHNLTDNGLTLAQVEDIFQSDVHEAQADLQRVLPWVAGLTPLRQEVFVELVFNLGIMGLSQFHVFLNLAQAGKWDAASADLLTTKWSRQVKGRSVELAHLLL